MKKGGCSCEAEMWYGACVALALTGRVADALAPRSGEDGWRRRTQRKMREANRPTVWRRRTIWSLCSRKECHHPHWIFWHLPKQRHKREGAWCLSLDLSHLCTHSTHIITHLLSACHPAGSRSSWRSISVCHVVSLLLCNFLFFFFLSSFPERMCLLFLYQLVSGGKTTHFSVWLSYRLSEVPEGFQEFQLLHPQLWRYLRECHTDHTRHFLCILMAYLPAVSSSDVRI